MEREERTRAHHGPSDVEVEAAARALYEMSPDRRPGTGWGNLAKYQQREWREKAQVVLTRARAAREEDSYDR